MEEGYISLQMLKKFCLKPKLGTVDALVLLTHDLQESLDNWDESRVLLKFSFAFDLLNHQALLFKLRLIWYWWLFI